MENKTVTMAHGAGGKQTSDGRKTTVPDLRICN